MHAPLPLLDPLLWLRVVAAAAVVVWAPGHLLAGRWLTGRRPFDRLVLSTGCGLALPFLFQAGPGRMGVPFAPSTFLAFAVLLAAAVRFLPAWRPLPAAWTQGVPEAGRAGRLAFGAALALGIFAVVAGQGMLSAPPHVHDASNHAWITQRVMEARSLAPSVVAGEGPGFLDTLYAPGLHGSAALVAGLGGVAPYVAVWMLTLVVLFLVPAAWGLLWRAWGLPGAACALGVVLATANPLGPAGILGWGGFGQIVGFFLAPVGALAVAAAWRRPTVGQGLVAGALLGGMAFLHFSEVLVAGGLACLVRAEAPESRDGAAPGRRALSLVALALAAVAVAAPELWPLARSYQPVVAGAASATEPLGDALKRLGRSGGRDLLQALLPLGYGFGLARRRSRAVAATGLVLGLWYVALLAGGDALSRALARPFYQQAPRILYLQFYFAAPLIALPLLALGRWLGRRSGRAAVGRATVAVLVLAALGLGLPRVVEVLRSGRRSVPFTVADYEQAVQVGRTVPPGEVVANFWDDGSSWAAQVSGRPFLQPTAWGMRDAARQDLHDLLPHLLDRPWPEPLTELLRREGIHWLYVSDTVLGDGPAGLRRADFDADPRFTPVVVGKTSTLYRIAGGEGLP